MINAPFDLRSDASILSTFGMSPGEVGRGFDTVTQCRVYADGLIRSRGRFAHYRTLYAAFVGGESLFMIENLDEAADGQGTPAKLAFADVEPGPEVMANPLAVVWTERALLEALTEERAMQDFFADLLDELAPPLMPDLGEVVED
jgi:hypothetical protein